MLDIEAARAHMIAQQIRPWGVLDERVLTQLQQLRREDFVPAAYRSVAFTDTELPLNANESMIAPKVEGKILQTLQLQGDETILQIGAGSGYLTGLLAGLSASVTAYEIDATLAANARSALQRAGVRNAAVHHGDGVRLDSSGFAVVVFSGSVEQIPANYLDRLPVGGKIFAVVGQNPVMRATLITRESPTDVRTEQPWDTVIPALHHFPKLATFVF